jgi:hypothetical protein
MRENIRARMEYTLSASRQFTLQIAYAADYRRLFGAIWENTAQEKDVLKDVLKHGRVMLSAEAGSGKTWLLSRLALRASYDPGLVTVWISLKDLTSLGPASRDAEAVARSLVELANPPLKPVLTIYGAGPKVLVIADGLNEIAREYAQPALEALDELARRYPFVCLIVSDRLVRRSISLPRWKLLTVLPLAPAEIERVWHLEKTEPLPEKLGLLARPFFLDTALKANRVGNSNARAIELFFVDRVALDYHSLRQLSIVAFAAYARHRSRMFELSEIEGGLDPAVLTGLQESGTLRISGAEAWFSHHLLHDFLAAYDLVQRTDAWSAADFDVITLGAASFDALRLAVEQIPNRVGADRFVRAVYDWNYFGASYSLVDGHVSYEMQVMILAMIAEKRWDPVVATVQAALDALRLDGSAIANTMTTLPSRDTLIQLVQNIDTERKDFLTWRDLFGISDGTSAAPDLVARLASADPIQAWTLANVLRRCVLDDPALSVLLEIATEGSPVQRWRAVHALGVHPTRASATVVLNCLKDKDKWVRYGAVRSLVEQAATTGDKLLRDDLIGHLISAVQKNLLDVRMLNELARVLNVFPQPAGWAQSITPLVQQLVGVAVSAAEQERWAGVMEEISMAEGNDA